MSASPTILSNGHLGPDGDLLLPGVRAFWTRIPDGDTIIVVSARKERECAAIPVALERWGLLHSAALFGAAARQTHPDQRRQAGGPRRRAHGFGGA